MEKRTGIFEGNDPFALARDWMSAAEAGELNDPNAMALSTVDRNGMPNAPQKIKSHCQRLGGFTLLDYTNLGCLILPFILGQEE